ncbi:MAG: DUF3710 domain-containing protein [Ancrocorticia sp.]|jgi:hypothetical protein|nr:DUF3710 domain-containing protein [Ancrocorticia sp.]MCI1895632.1 DUF3710 domain-containing protein [Ancrocorticia sp.]MCI1932369.1 DUF3710 domain-containing protein [Ancrocorticia sp.]MCI1962972.1 DUF3710 domain-containing protein [Ancrocorticia sp.]MCI2001340.1 DUF3710 domain-containing protein [Ancrocorticia sp.]
MGLFSRKKDKPVAEPAPEEETDPGIGPWDEESHPERSGLIDAGALLLVPVKGASIQFTVDRNRKVVLGVVYLKDNSAIQLQVFAAPKSRGLWDDVRADLVSSIASQGGKFEETTGEYGKEVDARMPVPGNAKGVAPVRYIGIDGPRWLLRVTVSGKAALDAELRGRLVHEVLDGLVVVRGQVPHPPREILELRIPRQKNDEDSQPTKLSPPKRGPEIAEVR